MDSDKQTAGAKITIINAELLSALAQQVSFLLIPPILILFLYKKAAGPTALLLLTDTFRIQYPRSCNTKSCQSNILNHVLNVVLRNLNIDIAYCK